MYRRANHAFQLLACVLLVATGTASAACKIVQVAEWQVDLSRDHPVIDGTINGKPIRILLATGSDRSFLVGQAARAIGLPLRQYSDRKQYTTSGVIQVLTTNVQRLQIGTLGLKDLTLYVLDSKDAPSDITFMIGSDFFSAYDTEFDLAHGKVRLFLPAGCKPEQLVYWNNGYFMTKLTTPSSNDPHLAIQVLLNGSSVHAWLSTTASSSVVDKVSAQNMGVKLGTDAAPLLPQVAGDSAWAARIDTLAIGNETIHNARLRVADLFGQDSVHRTGSMLPQKMEGFAEMLLGVDFLMAHRVMILPHEHLMLFTYNGGPIFKAPALDAVHPEGQPKPSDEPATTPTQQ